MTTQSIQNLIGKVVLNAAVPIAIAMFSFLINIQSTLNKLVINQEQTSNKLELHAKLIDKLTLSDVEKKSIDQRQDEDIKILKAQIQAASTKTELLETMKRVELVILREESKGRSMKDILKEPLRQEIQFLENREKSK